MPLKTVKKDGFREYTKELDHRYILPERKTLRNTLIPKMSNVVDENLKKKFENIKWFALSTDMWSSIITESWNNINVHYYDPILKKLQVIKSNSFFSLRFSNGTKKDIYALIKKTFFAFPPFSTFLKSK